MRGAKESLVLRPTLPDVLGHSFEIFIEKQEHLLAKTGVIKFWRAITRSHPPLYGADVEASLFAAPAPGTGWNLRRLDTLLTSVLEQAGHPLPACTTPCLCFGQWRTMSAWERFEQLVHSLVPHLAASCPQYLRHKDVVISPALLDTHKLPYLKLVQHPGEFVVTFP
ncbi:Jumonji domain-containing protein, partial [Haematococcus lacustris]